MGRFAVVLLLALLCVGAFGQTRGVLLEKLPEPTPFTGIEVKAQLSAVMPFWSTGNDLNALSPLFGVGITIPQPKKSLKKWLCPDAFTGFVTSAPVDGRKRFRPGASLDWDTPLKYVQGTVMGVFDEGAALGLKTTLAQF